MQVYKNALKEANKSTPAEFPIIKEMHVATTREEAVRVAQPYLEGKYQAYADWGQDKAMPGQEPFRVPFADLARDRFILGSVDDVIAQQKTSAETESGSHTVLGDRLFARQLDTQPETLPAARSVAGSKLA